MAKTAKWNYTDSGAKSPATLTLAPLNFADDFRVVTDGPGEALIANLTTPLNKAERFRFAESTVQDVYKGTDIDKSARAATKTGVSVLVQLTDVITVSNSDDPSYEVDLPISAHVVLKVPAHEAVTETMVVQHLTRMISGCFDTGSNTGTRLAGMLRGALLPTVM